MVRQNLQDVTGMGKQVRPSDKETGQRYLLGHVVDEVSVLGDGENKYVIQVIDSVRLQHI